MGKSTAVIGIIVAVAVIGIIATILASDTQNSNPGDIIQQSENSETSDTDNFYIDDDGVKHYVVEAVDSISTDG